MICVYEQFAVTQVNTGRVCYFLCCWWCCLFTFRSLNPQANRRLVCRQVVYRENT